MAQCKNAKASLAVNEVKQIAEDRDCLQLRFYFVISLVAGVGLKKRAEMNTNRL